MAPSTETRNASSERTPNHLQSQSRPGSIHRENAKHPSLNSTLGCITIVDTFRIFMDGTRGRHAAVQPLLSKVDFYPLSRFDGKMKTKDWSKLPHFLGLE